ncbi:MAG: sigma-70 family RNA polymerase sigma factor [Planctomycetes bacterium]|nr:sigma-70 family RNA polymerase sigma factor [Planctomycetota bacterium]
MDADRTDGLLTRARGGDAAALSELFQAHEARLLRLVELRLDARLRRRLDPADVVQEAWLEAARRFEAWSARGEPPFRVWLRLTAVQALATAQRRHLGTGARDAQREEFTESRPSVSAASAAELFVASATSPSQGAHRAELCARVLAALEELDELDREIVALRHFEGLSNEDAAAELAIEPAAASKRFVRALLRLRPALEALHSGVVSEGA